MKSNESAYPKSASWARPAGLLAVAGVAGVWLGQTHDSYVLLGLAIGLVALTAALGVVWLYRVRAARRLFAALDAYAEKEATRAGRRPHTPSRPRVRTAKETTHK